MIYPAGKEERAALREQQVNAAVEWAAQTALTQMVSQKCSGYNHAGHQRHADQVDGCFNDGTTCLCECHDGQDGA